MPFQRLLHDLVCQVRGAQGAVMSAYDGEPVVEVLAASSAQLDRFGVQLLGAQLRSAVTQIRSLHTKLEIPDPELLVIRSHKGSLFVHYLRDEYFILLAVDHTASSFESEYRLRETALLVDQAM